MNRISGTLLRTTPRPVVWVIIAALLGCASLHAPAQTNTNPVAAPGNEAGSGPAPAPRRPNIILIMADNVGYGDLGCYGQARIRTPNLDRLAAEGIRFTSYYTGSPEDETARAALLTGMEPARLTGGFNQPLPPDAVTIADLLKQQGFRTGYIGVWPLGDVGATTPAGKGFEDFAGFFSHGHARDYFTDRWQRRDTINNLDAVAMIGDNFEGKKGRFLPDLMSLAAANFSGNNRPNQRNHYRPFFLCVAYPIPHHGSLNEESLYATESWSSAQKIRAALITRMDSGIGMLLNRLRELRLETNTVVFFTSVNGPSREGPMDPQFFRSTASFRGQHGSVYEGGLRVPMIVRWPAQIPAGSVSDLPWAAWDFLPTAAGIALSSPPENIDGISVLPALRGLNQTNRHETLYWESRGDALQQAVRAGEWKAVRLSETNQVELYNLRLDPGEQRNLADRNPEVVANLEKILNDRRAPATTPAPAVEQAQPAPSAGTPENKDHTP